MCNDHDIYAVPSLYIAAADQQFQQLLHYSHENTIIHVTGVRKSVLCIHKVHPFISLLISLLLYKIFTICKLHEIPY